MNCVYGAFQERVRKALALPPVARARIAAYEPELAYGRHWGPLPENAQRGAALVLLYPQECQWHLVLTARQTHLARHAGQVSLPGGKCEFAESAAAAAVREYREEVGPLAEVELLGELSTLYVYASNFSLTPCVAVVDEPPRFRPDPAEVADVLSIPLDALANTTLWRQHTVERGPFQFKVPCFPWKGRIVWGATWLAVGELLERLLALGPIPAAR
jgi:8-oxo-dGTP pyrophosphatase MutT (NUDIX family)